MDTLAPSRRFELLYPAIAAELDEVENLPPVSGALRLLDLAERELSGRMPDFPARAFEAVRQRALRAASPAANESPGC